jgi:hypothetical protein
MNATRVNTALRSGYPHSPDNNRLTADNLLGVIRAIVFEDKDHVCEPPANSMRELPTSSTFAVAHPR